MGSPPGRSRALLKDRRDIQRILFDIYEPVIPPALFLPVLRVKKRRSNARISCRPPCGLEDDLGGSLSGRRRGAAAARGGAAGQMVGRNRGTQAAGAGRRRGLPPSHLRRQIPARPALDIAARRRVGRGVAGLAAPPPREPDRPRPAFSLPPR